MNILIHGVAFLLVGALLGLALRGGGVLLVVLLAVGSELAQPWFGRMCDPLDMALNLIAGLVGLELVVRGGR